MNRPLISEPGLIDKTTGVRRTDLWVYDCEGSGAYGDNARGEAYVSSYASDDCACRHPLSAHDGEFGCELCEDSGADHNHLFLACGAAEIAVYPTLEEWGWDVCEQTTAGEAVTEDGLTRPNDQADITYEYPHALIIDSLEEAQKIAKRIGSQDYSYALSLRRRENGESK